MDCSTTLCQSSLLHVLDVILTLQSYIYLPPDRVLSYFQAPFLTNRRELKAIGKVMSATMRLDPVLLRCLVIDDIPISSLDKYY